MARRCVAVKMSRTRGKMQEFEFNCATNTLFLSFYDDDNRIFDVHVCVCIAHRRFVQPICPIECLLCECVFHRCLRVDIDQITSNRCYFIFTYGFAIGILQIKHGVRQLIMEIKEEMTKRWKFCTMKFICVRYDCNHRDAYTAGGMTRTVVVPGNNHQTNRLKS